MIRYVFAAAAMAALGFAGSAFAEDATKGSGTLTTGPVAMTDAEMDKVTAGAIIDNPGVVGTTGPLAAGTPPGAVGVNLFIKKPGKSVVEIHTPGAP